MFNLTSERILRSYRAREDIGVGFYKHSSLRDENHTSLENLNLFTG